MVVLPLRLVGAALWRQVFSVFSPFGFSNTTIFKSSNKIFLTSSKSFKAKTLDITFGVRLE